MNTQHKTLLRLFVDGASRGNPGPSAIGAHVVMPSDTTHDYGACIGKATNNQAEYLALLLGLFMIDTHKLATHVQSIRVTADSELMIKQMNGIYRIKDATLARMRLAIDVLIVRINRPVHFGHVLRAHNAAADALANEALDQRTAPPASFITFLHSMQIEIATKRG